MAVEINPGCSDFLLKIGVDTKKLQVLIEDILEEIDEQPAFGNRSLEARDPIGLRDLDDEGE